MHCLTAEQQAQDNYILFLIAKENKLACFSDYHSHGSVPGAGRTAHGWVVAAHSRQAHEFMASNKATVTVGATTDFLTQSSSASTDFVPDQFNFTNVCL